MSHIVVFWKKLNRDGSLHQKFQCRLDAAIRLLATQKKVTRIIVSWWKTRKNCPSEAQAGKEYLLKKWVTVSIELEEESQTTIQNLAQIERLLSGVWEKIFVIISSSSYERVSAFCEWYFPNLYPRIEFIQAGWWFTLRDYLLNLPFKYLR